MFEIRLRRLAHQNHREASRRPAKGSFCWEISVAVLRGGAGARSNYVQPVSLGDKWRGGGLLSPPCIHLWSVGGLQPSIPSGRPPSSDYETPSESGGAIVCLMV